MELEPANIVCPVCGSGNYMRHLIGKNVGYLDIKCINCNSYFNFDELYKRRIGEVLKPKLVTNADRIRAMSDEELAKFLLNRDLDGVEKASKAVGFTYKVDREQCLVDVIDWLKQEVERDE